MDIFGVLSLIGGLAIFLYGMDLLGEGLTGASGGKLEKILEKLTSNPLKAVLLGAGVTAVIQSSSATTVMVVGFVNSGIMKLSQAVGVIMGANIGTTITSWILSLTGIESSVKANLIFASSCCSWHNISDVFKEGQLKESRKDNDRLCTSYVRHGCYELISCTTCRGATVRINTYRIF